MLYVTVRQSCHPCPVLISPSPVTMSLLAVPESDGPTGAAAVVLGESIYRGCDPRTAYELMVEEGRLSDLKAFLPAYPNLTEHKINHLDQTALIVAAHQADIDMFTYLRGQGAQLQATDHLGRNAAFFWHCWPKKVTYDLDLNQPSPKPTPEVILAALNRKMHLANEHPNPLYDCYLAQGDHKSARACLQGLSVVCGSCKEDSESIWITPTWMHVLCGVCYETMPDRLSSAHIWYLISNPSPPRLHPDDGSNYHGCHQKLWHQGIPPSLREHLHWQAPVRTDRERPGLSEGKTTDMLPFGG